MVRTLRTERLWLRNWRKEDFEPFAALNADPEVMAHFPSTLDRTQSDDLALRIAADLEARHWGLWAVEVAGERTFIGFVGLAEATFEAAFTPAVEVGWRLARRAWGNGYATEGARAALDLAFTELGLPEVVSFTSTGNRRSRAVMERLGMHRDPSDDFQHPRVPEGSTLRHHVLYRLPASEWPSGAVP